MNKKKKIKFISLYNTFSEEERIQFRSFISMPMFNAGRNYNEILNYIDLDSSVFFEFGNSKKERTLWNRLSELTKLAEKFLVCKAAEAGNSAYNSLLLSELKKRALNDYFEMQVAGLKSKLKDSLLKDMNLNEYLEVNKQYLEHLEYVNSNPKPKIYFEQFKETNNSKFALFVLEMLDDLIQLWQMKTSKFITSGIFLEDFFKTLNFKEILLIISKNVPDIYPMIAFQYYVYNSLLEPLDPAHYENAKKIFNKELKSIPEEYREKLYGNMMEHHIALLNMDQPGAGKELFDLIKQKLKEGLCGDIKERNFVINKFRNFVLVSLALKKYKWTENFIDEYGPKLPEEFRDDNVFLGKALLMIRKKEFLLSKELLSNIKGTNPFHYIDASRLKLIVSYELKEFVECHEGLRRLMQYLRAEHMVQEDLVKNTKNFCTSYSLLLKLRQNPTKKNLYNLQFELDKGSITGRKWIREKFNEIAKQEL